MAQEIKARASFVRRTSASHCSSFWFQVHQYFVHARIYQALLLAHGNSYLEEIKLVVVYENSNSFLVGRNVVFHARLMQRGPPPASRDAALNILVRSWHCLGVSCLKFYIQTAHINYFPPRKITKTTYTGRGCSIPEVSTHLVLLVVFHDVCGTEGIYMYFLSYGTSIIQEQEICWCPPAGYLFRFDPL